MFAGYRDAIINVVCLPEQMEGGGGGREGEREREEKNKIENSWVFVTHWRKYLDAQTRECCRACESDPRARVPRRGEAQTYQL